MNKVMLTGRLSRAPERMATAGATTVARCSVAVQRQGKNDRGEREADFIDLKAFGQQAEYLLRFAKGDRIELSGRWNTHKYDVDGRTATAHECIIESLSCFAKEKPEAKPEPKPEPRRMDYDDPDLPF